MIYISLFLLCITFIELFILLNLNSNIKSVLGRSRNAYEVIMSTELNDEEKEKRVRKSSLDIFRDTIIFFVKMILMTLILYIFYKVLLFLFSLSEDQVIAVSLSLYTVVALTLAALFYGWLRSVIIQRLQSR